MPIGIMGIALYSFVIIYSGLIAEFLVVLIVDTGLVCTIFDNEFLQFLTRCFCHRSTHQRVLVSYHHMHNIRLLVVSACDFLLNPTENRVLLFRMFKDGNLSFVISGVIGSVVKCCCHLSYKIFPPCFFLVIAHIGIVVALYVTVLCLNLDGH